MFYRHSNVIVSSIYELILTNQTNHKKSINGYSILNDKKFMKTVLLNFPFSRNYLGISFFEIYWKCSNDQGTD